MSFDSSAHQTLTGIVYKKSTGSYTVHTSEKIVECAASSLLRKELVYSTANPNSTRRVVQEVRAIQSVDPVAVGDQVVFIDSGDGHGMITEVLPRRNRLTRRASKSEDTKHNIEQIIAANIDQVITVMAAAKPEPHWALLDRYLTSAESLGLDALICITKVDLAEEKSDLEETMALYRQIGYSVLFTSSSTGMGISELQNALTGKTSVFIGKSGVGKTSLLNAVQPGLGRRVSNVNQITGKGRHTTTGLEMIALAQGGAIIDTPGMREFGLWDVDADDMAAFFPEMRPFLGTCKFGLDCSHDNEPGCAIRRAVMNGAIHPHRYQSMMKLREE